MNKICSFIIISLISQTISAQMYYDLLPNVLASISASYKAQCGKGSHTNTFALLRTDSEYLIQICLYPEVALNLEKDTIQCAVFKDMSGNVVRLHAYSLLPIEQQERIRTTGNITGPGVCVNVQDGYYLKFYYVIEDIDDFVNRTYASYDIYDGFCHIDMREDNKVFKKFSKNLKEAKKIVDRRYALKDKLDYRFIEQQPSISHIPHSSF